jgi:hypothetical protein
MLSPQTVWHFSVAADINSNVFGFYFLIWSLSRLLCCVVSGSNIAVALGSRKVVPELSQAQSREGVLTRGGKAPGCNRGTGWM